MYRFSGMGLLPPRAGRFVTVASGDPTLAGRFVSPVVRTGTVSVLDLVTAGRPGALDVAAPESAPIADVGESAGPVTPASSQVMISSAPVPSPPPAPAPSAAGDSFISSIPWWGWALAAGVGWYATKGGR